MWILNALDEIPIKRMMIWWTVIHAAAFLIMDQFFWINPLNTPVIPLLAVLTVYLLNFKKSSLRRALLLIPVAAATLFLLYPAYWIFSATAISLLVGKLVYHQTFRWWQFASTIVLFIASLIITVLWGRVPFLYSSVPDLLIPAIRGGIFGFLACCSFLPYSIRKNKVEEAFAATEWKNNSDSAELAARTMESYHSLIPLLKQQDFKVKQQTEEFIAGILPLCSKLHQMEHELSRIKLADLEIEARELEGRSAAANDPIATEEYERALNNKKRQIAQMQSLNQNAERIKARVVHCLTALENMRFAYANREFVSSNESALNIEFFLNMTSVHADQTYETSEAYWQL